MNRNEYGSTDCNPVETEFDGSQRFHNFVVTAHELQIVAAWMYRQFLELDFLDWHDGALSPLDDVARDHCRFRAWQIFDVLQSAAANDLCQRVKSEFIDANPGRAAKAFLRHLERTGGCESSVPSRKT